MPPVTVLGINHQSPLIYCVQLTLPLRQAGNQSPIPFDILVGHAAVRRPRLGINHQSPLIYWAAGLVRVLGGWESITNPL